jgi:putative endonuclease
MSAARQKLGRAAEELVAGELVRLGWRIVERNFRCRSGEIDLIALDGSILVFVEVKAGRQGSRYGPERPAYAVGPRKQLRLRRLAREWLAGGGRAPRPSGVSGYRFDVVGVTFSGDGRPDVDHIRDAF